MLLSQVLEVSSANDNSVIWNVGILLDVEAQYRLASVARASND